MQILWETVSFAAKGGVVFLTVVVSAAVLIALARRGRARSSRLEVKPLNERFEALADGLRQSTLGRKRFRAFAKDRAKARQRSAAATSKKPRLFVLDFKGDLLAGRVRMLREEVSAIVGAAEARDGVLLRLESPGGSVPHYGLAAAQLVRLRDKGLRVTVAIDRMAASGGYMMACIADEILAAPFAIIGSIGVTAAIPNVHRLLKRHDVDYEDMTAGEFKRTVSLFGEITTKGREKFQAQLDEAHRLFKQFVKTQRPKLDIDAVATGEYWLAGRAVELGLVDRLSTSDDYLLARVRDAEVFAVSYRPAQAWRGRLSGAAAQLLEQAVRRVLGRLEATRLR